MVDRAAELRNPTRVRTVGEVLGELDAEIRSGAAAELIPVPTHFHPLDQVLSGGIRPGDLMLVGGMPGVGKTIVTLQWARNMALSGVQSVYVCYEHEESNLLGRLLALEIGELPHSEDDTEMEKLRLGIQEVASGSGRGIREVLESEELADRAWQHIDSYADSLFLVRGSGANTGLGELEDIVVERMQYGPTILFVDYLQKVSVRPEPAEEDEKVTRITEGLKELALKHKIPVVCVVAADKEGLQSKRLRLHHLRGSSALMYECDIALLLNDKFNTVSRVHLAYDPVKAETYRDYVVFTIEKNRGGPNLIDIEFRKDFLYYRFEPIGGIVAEKLVDERIYSE